MIWNDKYLKWNLNLGTYISCDFPSSLYNTYTSMYIEYIQQLFWNQTKLC